MPAIYFSVTRFIVVVLLILVAVLVYFLRVRMVIGASRVAKIAPTTLIQERVRRYTLGNTRFARDRSVSASITDSHCKIVAMKISNCYIAGTNNVRQMTLLRTL